jgi:uncharacterized protein YlxP (DUF503 family)
MSRDGGGGFVAVLVISLHLPEAESLKGKRRELAPVKTWLRGRAGWSVAETGMHEKWQRAELTASYAGTSPTAVSEACDSVRRWLDAHFPEAVAGVEKVVVSVEDLRS